MKHKKRLEKAVEAALRAGEILLEEYHAEDLDITQKSPTNPVTRADYRSEELIEEVLMGNFPDDQMLGEEEGERYSERTDTPRWIVDPLDGTVNFSHGFPWFCVSIALQKANETVLGVIYEPLRRDLFWATDETSSFIRPNLPPSEGLSWGETTVEQLSSTSETLAVSDNSELLESICATGFPYDFMDRPDRILERFRRVTVKIQGVRRAGAAALDLVMLAQGQLDGYWEQDLNPWDTSAGALLVRNAGGRITNFEGEPWEPGSPTILATNGKIHESLQQLVSNSSPHSNPAASREI